MTKDDFIPGECQGIPVKVINVFMGDTYIEWPGGQREWVGREMHVHWSITKEGKDGD